jgi:hypothetical protein
MTAASDERPLINPDDGNSIATLSKITFISIFFHRHLLM